MVFDLLYGEYGFDHDAPYLYGVQFDSRGMIRIKKVIEQGGDEEEVFISGDEFDFRLHQREISFILAQIALEADLCYGRNSNCKLFFKRRYPAHLLISNIVDENVQQSLKSSLMRVLTYLYIDDAPHEMMKYSRAFKAYQSNKTPDEFLKSTFLEEGQKADLCQYV